MTQFIKSSILTFFIVHLTSNISGQNNFFERDYILGEGVFIDTASNGNYLIGANVDNNGTKSTYYFLINDIGDTIKSMSYINLELRCIRQTPDKGFILIGDSSLAVLCKMDSLGNLEWTKFYPTLDWGTSGESVLNHSSGGYIVAYMDNDEMTSDYYHLVITDSSGQTINDKIIGSELAFNGNGVRKTSDNGIIAVSNTWSGDGFKLTRLDNSGNILWSKFFADSFNLFEFYEASTVFQSADGGFLIGSYTALQNAGYFKSLIKTDSLGNLIWSKSYDSTTVGNSTFNVVEDSGGNIYLSGNHFIQGPSGVNFFPNVYLIKTNSFGDTLWTRNFYGKGYTVVSTMMLDRNGNPMLIGTDYDTLSNQKFIYLIKTDTSGNISSGINFITEDNPFNIWPNPSTGEFSIEGVNNSNNKTYITIYNALGVKILEKKFNENNTISLSNNPSGVYVAEIRQGVKKYFKRIVLLH